MADCCGENVKSYPSEMERWRDAANSALRCPDVSLYARAGALAAVQHAVIDAGPYDVDLVTASVRDLAAAAYPAGGIRDGHVTHLFENWLGAWPSVSRQLVDLVLSLPAGDWPDSPPPQFVTGIHDVIDTSGYDRMPEPYRMLRRLLLPPDAYMTDSPEKFTLRRWHLWPREAPGPWFPCPVSGRRQSSWRIDEVIGAAVDISMLVSRYRSGIDGGAAASGFESRALREQLEAAAERGSDAASGLEIRLRSTGSKHRGPGCLAYCGELR